MLKTKLMIIVFSLFTAITLFAQKEVIIEFGRYPGSYRVSPRNMKKDLTIKYFGEYVIENSGAHLSHVPDMLGHQGHEGGIEIICKGQVDIIDVEVSADKSGFVSNGMDLRVWAKFLIPALEGQWNEIVNNNPIQIKGSGNHSFKLKRHYNAFSTNNVVGMSQGLAGKKAKETKIVLSAYGYDDFIIKKVKLIINY